MSDLSPKYVRFDANYVGWGKGLEVAVKDAISLKVPLGVRARYYSKVREMLDVWGVSVEVLVIEE